MNNTVRIRRFKAAIGLVACVVMLSGGNFSAKGQQPAPSLDSPALRGDGQLQLKVRGIGNFVYELQGSQDLTNWVPVQQQATDWYTNAASFQFPVTNEWRFFRALGIRKSNYPLFQAGLMVRNSINLAGNNFLSDSYDSSNPNYSFWVTNSTWGTNLIYSAAKRRDHGDVAAMGGITNFMNLGNASIYGRLGTSPTGISLIGPNGSVGDMTWQSSGQTGIEPGFSSSQMNMDFPTVAAPVGLGIPPIGGNYAGTFYDYLLSSPGALYVLNSALSGKICVTATNAVLWAKGGINLSGKDDGIFIASGASVIVYIGNTSGASVSADFSGRDGVNAMGYARKCQIYGLNTCTSISLSGSSAFVGTIYAPNADVITTGGGNSTTDSMGSIIAKGVILNGHWDLHFDEALLINGPGSLP